MDRINCNICELRCRLGKGRSGACGLYERHENQIVECFADRYLVACPISIETMPILHFYPGSKFLQITTTGCNFNCPGCISTVLVREMSPDSSALMHLSPEAIIAKAFEADCEGVVFLMNDPLAAFSRFLKIASLAHAAGLKVGCSTNAYFTQESLDRLLPLLDFVNIGMKGFTDRAYHACGAPEIQPVLRNVKTLYQAGIHIEVSCILTRTNQTELLDLALYLSGISREIPLQVMRFLPFESASPDQEPDIRDAEEFCGKLGHVLDYVYLFNTPGTRFLHTRCPRCGKIVQHRDFYGPMGAKIMAESPNGITTYYRCPSCSHDLKVIGRTARTAYQEGDFEGGYPLTRALEMVEAILIAIGVTQKSVVVGAWEDVLQQGGLNKLHKSIQHPRSYIGAVRYFGGLAGARDRAEVLAGYLENRLEHIESALESVSRRPRVYYAMGKPLFCINGGRLENQLVETGGGISVNRGLPDGGRPGRTLTVDALHRLNPEVMFISAFISCPVEDFYAECVESGLKVDAVVNRRIYSHPSAGWDFGSPRWILGLMYIASVLHPDRCRFDMMEEADSFYRRFYGIPFDSGEVNRSFSKPNRSWRWLRQD